MIRAFEMFELNRKSTLDMSLCQLLVSTGKIPEYLVGGLGYGVELT